MVKLLDPIPPGEILQEEFLVPFGISQNRLARDIDVPVSRVAGIVAGVRAITADTALRLGAYFGTSAEMWLNLQTEYDLRRMRRTVWPQVRKRIRPMKAA
jgi:antitoxin HigA-1